MPRFYFHLRDDVTVDDQEGQELPDAETATERAFAYARDLAAQSALEGHLTQSHYIRIVGPGGEEIGTVTFGEAVEVRP